MAENNNYHDEVNKQNVLKMREVLKTLPAFCREYFIGIQEQTAARTRLAYAYDIRIFFEYLHSEIQFVPKRILRSIPWMY